jgi:hypothetical protein
MVALLLLNRFAFLGFAVGGWTGLPQFREALQAARLEQTRIELVLLLVMLLGGITFTSTLAEFNSLGGYLRKLPIYFASFCIVTAIVAWLAVEIAVLVRRPVIR